RTESPISPEKGDATKAPPTSVAPTQKEMQGPTSEPKSPGVDESQQCLSEIGIEQKSDNPAEHAEEGWENIEDLVLDPGMFPRAELNVEHVTHLQERIEAGDHIPTIGVTRPDLKIITGAHRHEALKLVSKKVRMGQLKTDSLGYPMNAEGTKIRLRYVVIPDGVDAMIYCYQQNTTHGLRPSPSDTKRVVESYYRTHQGCSAQFFAE